MSQLTQILKSALRRSLSYTFKAIVWTHKKIRNFLKKRFSFLPAKQQSRLLFSVLSQKEKFVFLSFLFCFILSFLFLSSRFYLQKTEIKPANGGIINEGIVGQPRFINPVLASNDIDRDLIELLFSGLMKYDVYGNIKLDLAESYEVLSEGRIYEVYLKENIFWHDGEPITSNDVIFTIKTIQDPAYKSPEIINWVGITIEKISDKKVVLKLSKPYFPFLERLTLKILPEHIFKNIPPENFALTNYNLEPIGSGPFEFKELKHDKLGQIEFLTLKRNTNYFGQSPYLDEIKFRFYQTEQDLADAGQRGQVQTLAISNPDLLETLKNSGFSFYNISLPRYFAVFINQSKSKPLNQEKVRKALNLAINKQKLLDEVSAGSGRIVFSPIMPDIYGIASPLKNYDYNLPEAKKLLKEAGFEEVEGKFIYQEKTLEFNFTLYLQPGSKGKQVEDLQTCLSRFPDIYPEAKITGLFGDSTKKAVIAFQEKYQEEILAPWGFDSGTGIVAKTTREKLNKVCNQKTDNLPILQFTLQTVNQALMIKIAENVKAQWEELGITIQIETKEFSELSKEVIKPRNYEMLLFGQALNIIPDPFAFWHSSKTKDPGLNLSLYENKDADTALKTSREAETIEDFKQYLEDFQDVILKDMPAVFLYSPDFTYLASSKVQGINNEIIADPSKRFVGAENWYIRTSRHFVP